MTNNTSMTTAKMGAFRLFLFVVWVSELVACSPTTPTFVFAEAVPAPPVKCSNDLYCSPGMYCRNTGFCASCVDCQKQHRQPSANQCAKASSECGPCEEGYKEVAEHCTDEDENAGNSGSFTNKAQEFSDHPKKPSEKDGKATNNLALWWGLGIITVLGTTGIIFGIGYFVHENAKKSNSRHRRLSGSGEKGQGDDEQSDGITTQAPSAPLLPEEYNCPPPYAATSGNLNASNYRKSPMNQFINPAIMELIEGQSQSWHLPHHSQPRVINNLVAASPFNVGNGAGEWARAAQNADDNQGVDNNDGGAPPPIQDQNPVNEEEEEVVENPVQQEQALDNNDMEMNEMMDLGPLPVVGAELDNGNYADEEEEGNLDEIQDMENIDPDDLFFDFGFRVDVEVHVHSPLRVPDQQARQRERSRSAPYQIDDSVFDLSELTNANSSQGSSALSMAQSSGDSGTGTSNEDDTPSGPPRLVPSLTNDLPSSQVENDDSSLYGDDLYEDDAMEDDGVEEIEIHGLVEN